MANIMRKTYQDWTQGQWWAKGPEHGPREGKFYSAVNMQVYSNGLLGPRPWARVQQELADNAQQAYTDFVFGSSFEPFEYDIAGTGSRYVYLYWVDNSTTDRITKVTFDRDGYSAKTSFTPSANQAVQTVVPLSYAATHYPAWATATEYLSTEGIIGAILHLDGYSGSTVTDVDTWTPDNLTHMFEFKSRWWAWESRAATETGTIYFSSLGDITAWNANDFISPAPVNSTVIVAAYPQQNGILIASKDGRWWYFTYTSTPAEGTMRYLGRFMIPHYAVTGAQLDSAVLFLPDSDHGISVASSQGVDYAQFRDIRPSAGYDNQAYSASMFYPLRGVTALKHGAVFLPFFFNTDATVDAPEHIGDESLDLVNDVWTRSCYWRQFDGSDISAGTYKNIKDWFSLGQSVVGFVGMVETLGSEGWTIYTRDVCLDRPSRSDDIWSDSNEWHVWSEVSEVQSAGGMLKLETLQMPDGQEFRYHRIIIDLVYWKETTGNKYGTVNFKLDAYGHSHDSNASVTLYDMSSQDTSGWADSDTTGMRQRLVIPLAQGKYWNKSQLVFTDINAIAFDKITVEYDTRAKVSGVLE